MEKKELKPKIRFKGFDCEWQTSTIRNISDEIIAGGDVDNAKLMRNGKYPVVANALSNEGIVGYYNDDYRIEAPAITITARGDIGYAKARKTNFTPIVRLISIKSKNNIIFLENAINRIKIKSESTGVPQLTVPAISNYDINITKDIDEQNKIGELFENVNEFISVNKERIEKWKNIRTSFLSKMFPKPGSRVPELRFKGFSGEWEIKKLKEIGNTYNGLSGKNREDFGHGDARYIPYLNIFNNPIVDEKDLERIEIDIIQNTVKKNDVFFTVSSETPGEVGMSSIWLGEKENVYLNSFCFGFRPSCDINPFYITYLLRSDYFRQQIVLLAQGISRFNISKTKVGELLIVLPSLEEQNVVGAFLNKLNYNIECQQQKLEKLKQIKQSFLSKMFV